MGIDGIRPISSPGFQAPLAGLQRATQRFARAAEELASPDPDLIGAVVDTITAEHEVRANAMVLRTTSRTLGALFDILA